jgi:hypothetical protein
METPQDGYALTSSEAAKQVICDIIAASGGKIYGKLRLYKAFYFAHLYYWLHGEGVLTDYPIVRMPQGPGIDNGDTLLEELEQTGEITISFRRNGPYKELVYERAHPFQVDPTSPRFQAIEEAVEWVRGKSAADLSEETHLYSRSWRETPDGEELDIYTDLLDDREYAKLKRSLSEAEQLIQGVFGK